MHRFFLLHFTWVQSEWWPTLSGTLAAGATLTGLPAGLAVVAPG